MVYNVLAVTEHEEKCLIINGKQNVNLEKGSISFKNHSKQLQVPFEMYAYFECILHPSSSLKENNDKKTSYTEKVIFLVVWLTKLFVLTISLVKILLFTEEKLLFTNLLKKFFKNMIIAMK